MAMQEIPFQYIMKQYKALHELIHAQYHENLEKVSITEFSFTLMACPLERSPSNKTYEKMVKQGLQEFASSFNIQQEDITLAFGDLHLQGIIILHFV